MKPTLAHINLFPIKSCAPLTPGHAFVESRGLRGDRRWMVVDAEGQFVTARKHSRLVLIRARFDAEALILDAPGMTSLRLTQPLDPEEVRTTIWRDEVIADVADAEANSWISEYLGFAARFAFMGDACRRPVDPDFAQRGDVVSFADGYPLMVISQTALDALNSRLPSPVPMLRFRPSLVVANTSPHAEDGWRSIRIGDVRFDAVKPCVRCVLTTVDPETGRFDEGGEPLRTLLSYRRTDKGVTFGQNLIPRGTGTIKIGDEIVIID
ncbi:MAG: MOSC N-terminal beta barrel domain-containing protein [Dokdonella sp.]